MRLKYSLAILALAVVAAGFGYAAPTLQGAGLEPGYSSAEAEGTLSILYYTSRDHTLTLKLDLEVDDPEPDTAYDFDAECRVYTNPADPAEPVMLKREQFKVRGGSDGKATKIIKLVLADPLPKAHILSWYVYDYQVPAE